jgi:hypothetical protein
VFVFVQLWAKLRLGGLSQAQSLIDDFGIEKVKPIGFNGF